MSFKPIDPQVKADIIHQIRNNGMRVMDAQEKYNVSNKTIYNWLRNGVTDGNRDLILENNRLKKENEQLYNLLGRATAELKHPKK